MPNRDPVKYNAYMKNYLKGYRKTERGGASARKSSAKYQKSAHGRKVVRGLHDKYYVTVPGRAGALLSSTKKRKKTLLGFDLDKAWIQERIAKGHCEVSGLPFVLTLGHPPHAYAPSIDRIDSLKGYSKGNCRVVLWCLNAAFGHWGFEEAAKVWSAVLTKHTRKPR